MDRDSRLKVHELIFMADDLERIDHDPRLSDRASRFKDYNC
jgi:hypothetical protein